MTNEEKAREIAEKEVHPIIAERCAIEEESEEMPSDYETYHAVATITEE